MNKRFVVVDRCPPDWAQGAIKSRCESTILSRQEKLLTLFVNGPGDIVFKNVYCTICHGIEEYDIRSWTVELWNCEPAEGETQPVLNGGKPDYTTCSNFHMEPPSMLYDPHRCYSSFVNRCTLSSTTTAEQMQLCENHTSLLFNQDVDVVYKNVHCWNCSRSTDVSNIQDLRCTQVLRDNRFNAAVSFTLIFDFTGRTVHSVERKGLFNGITSSPQLLRNCSQWQIYDPFQDVCQDLTCPNGQPPQSSSGACLDARQRKALGGSSNLSEDCIENLIAMNSSEMSTSTYLWTSADIADEGSDSPRHILNIYTSFASADRIQKSLDPILSNVTDTNSFASLSCNASLMILVASGESETNKKGICEGFSFGNISFSDLLVLDGVFSVNIGGFVYDQHEFMHETEYFFDINEASVIRRQSVTLCNPFVGSRRCSLLTLYPDDFFQSTDGGALIHAETGVPFLVGEYWLLPDGTVRVCQIVWYHVLGYVSYVGTCCSVLGLILALVTYGVFPSLRNTPGKIVMNLMGALLMAQLFLMFTDPKSWFCVLRALMLHFCWLSVFFWMNVLSCDLAYNLKCNVRPARPSRRGGSEGWKVLKLSAFAWGLPAVIVVSCFLASQFRPEWFGYGGSSCWIVGWITSAAFGLSISVAIIVNLAMFVYMVCIVIANHRRLVVARLAQKTKTTILLCFKILRSCFSSLRIQKQSCSRMEAKSVLLISAVVLSIVCLASSKSCSYTCQWPDVDRALCDSRFINIFRGIVRHVTKNSQEDYVDYAVEVMGVYRTEDSGLVSEGSTVNIRTTLHEYICPVVKMPVHFNAWFATGPLGQPQNDYRIATDSCTSFIATRLSPEVGNNLQRGKFNKPC